MNVCTRAPSHVHGMCTWHVHVQVRWEDPHAPSDAAGAGLEAPEATEWAIDAIAFGAGTLGIGLATAANGAIYVSAVQAGSMAHTLGLAVSSVLIALNEESLEGISREKVMAMVSPQP